jgi:hypothetical protein
MVPAVALNVVDVDPAATVIEAGTVSRPLLLESDTMAPPAGADWDNVTVQVDVTPLPKLDGAHDTELGTTGAVNVKTAVLMTLR